MAKVLSFAFDEVVECDSALDCIVVVDNRQEKGRKREAANLFDELAYRAVFIDGGWIAIDNAHWI